LPGKKCKSGVYLSFEETVAMHSNLAIQLSEGAFRALSNEASALGRTPEELAAIVVERTFGGGPSGRDAAAARLVFEQCFGSVDLGRPIGIANRDIDADIAGEYAVEFGTG
jgi:hypothetical protein